MANKSSLKQHYKLQHIDMSIQYVTEVVVPDVSPSQSIWIPSWTQQTMHCVLTMGHTSNPNSFLVVRSLKSCALIICWQSSTAFQSISSSDIFINSWTRSRNFHISQSRTIGTSLRNTRGAYSITTNQYHSVFDNIMRTRMFLLVCLCLCDVHVLTQSVVPTSLQEPLHNLFWCHHRCRPPPLHEINIRISAVTALWLNPESRDVKIGCPASDC